MSELRHAPLEQVPFVFRISKDIYMLVQYQIKGKMQQKPSKGYYVELEVRLSLNWL